MISQSDAGATSLRRSSVRPVASGTLVPLTDEILDQNDTRELVLNVLKESQRAKLEHEWELDFAVQIENLGRFRGNACYVLGRIEASFRYIPATISTLRDLGHGPTVEGFTQPVKLSVTMAESSMSLSASGSRMAPSLLA